MRRITLLTNPDMCNLNCPLCFLQQRGRSFGMGEMPFQVAKDAILKYYHGLREVIPSTMGEPLLYSKFKELVEFCLEKQVKLNLTTNGTFPGKWGSDEGIHLLLESCSDIKISTLAAEGCELLWKENVNHLLRLRGQVRRGSLATVSLQVTLHRKNVQRADALLRWAEVAGIDRIKWNPVVFLSVADRRLVAEYALKKKDVEELREKLVSAKLECGGSLFFGEGPASEKKTGKRIVGNRLQVGMSKNEKPQDCAFLDEIWILPDGSEQDCPNPERRFGDLKAAAAQCSNCAMRMFSTF